MFQKIENQIYDDDTPTQQEHCVGVLVGCDNDATYIPTSEEVYYSIDQDRLFADDDDNSTIGGDLPAFLGMAVTEDSSVDDSSDEFFDATDKLNIMLHALYRAARAQTRTMVRQRTGSKRLAPSSRLLAFGML